MYSPMVTLFGSVFESFSGLFDILAQSLHGITARQHQAQNKQQNSQNSFQDTITPFILQNAEQYYTSTVKKGTGFCISSQ